LWGLHGHQEGRFFHGYYDCYCYLPLYDHHFRQAVDWARRQGALSWEWRAATSLAHLLRNQGRVADAIAYSNRSTTALRRVSTPPI
jgi:hypothetical protein